MRNKKPMDLMAEALDELTSRIESTSTDPLAFMLNAARIDYLPAELILPDPVQAGCILPEAIHYAFHQHQYTPVQALRELIRIAQVAARQHGRPFANVAELVASLDSDEGEGEGGSKDSTVNYSPEEQLVRDLVTLAVTIRDDGQVNPLTVIDITQGVTRLFRIETGERRFWASWLLRELLPGYAGDGTIPCITISTDRASVFRQARENTARAGLSAIAMARQAALLLMAAHGIPKPDYAVDNDFYRQALDLDLRDKREYTDAILAAMGGISRMHFSHFKSLLRLSDEALELADRHTFDEWRLRFVISLAEDDHAEMVRQIIQHNLSGKQVKAICEQVEAEPSTTQESGLPRPAIRLAAAVKQANSLSGSGLAQALYVQEKDWHLARARLHMLKQIIVDAEQFIDVQ
jgi:hypothetical protein